MHSLLEMKSIAMKRLNKWI